MLNNWAKRLFKLWLSVQKIVLLLAVAFVLAICVSLYDLNRSEIASWVQALGALVSIWAAWSIARSQGLRAEAEARRSDEAKRAAVIGILEHSRSVIVSHQKMSNDTAKINNFLSDIARLIFTLDKLDLLSLPGPEFVNAVCSARQMLDTLQNEFKDTRTAYMHGIYFERSLGKRALTLLDKHITECTGG